uniref:Uncharacterized protein n=1 Tax=Arundo donax TaxID=35708 RepID=A0A0A9C1I5_ARUDO
MHCKKKVFLCLHNLLKSSHEKVKVFLYLIMLNYR